MIYFFFCQLGKQTKIDILRKERCCRTWKHLLWNKKKLCLLRAQFLLKNKHHRLWEKEEKPLLTHSLSDWWCCLGRAASEMAIREQTGWVLFNKTPFKREKQSQISRNGIWNRWNIIVWVYSLKNRENRVMSWSHPCDIILMWKTPDHTIMCDIMYWELHKWEHGFSVFYWIIEAWHWPEPRTIYYWGALRWKWRLSIGKVYETFTVAQGQCITHINPI